MCTINGMTFRAPPCTYQNCSCSFNFLCTTNITSHPTGSKHTQCVWGYFKIDRWNSNRKLEEWCNNMSGILLLVAGIGKVSRLLKIHGVSSGK